MKNNITIALSLFTALYFLLACNDNVENNISKSTDTSVVQDTGAHNMQITPIQKENVMMQSMMATMGGMDTATLTNNFDIDFAKTMIMHHQAAIDMSELLIAKGGDVQIIDMAKNIVTTQKAEIIQMKNFVANYTPKLIDKVDTLKAKTVDRKNILATEMTNMMTTMHNMKMTGNIDDDYVMLMIPHHASAVKMAKNEITYGKEATLKKMAQKMIKDQEKEIATFVAWSTKLK